MKHTLFLLLSILLLSCGQQKTDTSKPAETQNELSTIDESNSFNWLLGNWERVKDENEEKETFENWIRESDSRLLGHGFVMQGSDTIWQERMVLSNQDSIWILGVETPGNADLVEFVLTQSDANSFTVENPKHDFPQKIQYWKSDEKLNASVSGGEDEISFEFERVK